MRSVLSACLAVALIALIAHADSFDDAQKAFREKKYKVAVKHLNKHLEDKNTDARAYLLRGQILALQNKLAAATRDFDKAIELEPKKLGGYFSRGRIRARQGKFDDALADFDKTINLAPKMAMGYIERGYLNLDQAIKAADGNKRKEGFTAASKDFETAVKLNPKLPRAYYYSASNDAAMR